jgi:hypothetical protein
LEEKLNTKKQKHIKVPTSGIVLISLLFLCFSFASAQGGFRTRNYTINSQTHFTKDIFEISPGSYVGISISVKSSSQNNLSQITLVGLNSLGAVQWSKSYGTNNCQYLHNSITKRTAIKHAGAIYYAGAVRDSAQKQIGVLIKFDFIGNLIWQKFFRDSLLDVIPQVIAPSVDGGFLLTGFFQDWINPVSPCLLIKTDANGNELWRKKLNKSVPNVSDGKAVIQDSVTKKIIVVGSQNYGNANSWVPFDNVFVTDSLGTILNHTWFTPGQIHDIIRTKDKKYVVVGYNLINDFVPKYTSFVYKFDVNSPGVPIWRINNFGPQVDMNYFSSLKELPNEDILIAGNFDSLVTKDMRFNALSRFVRLNKNGQIMSVKDYDYAKDKTTDNIHLITCLNLTSDGGWITSVRCQNAGNNPMFYVKYDSTGCDSSTFYCKTVGLDELSKQGIHVNIYPNPFSEAIHLDFDESEKLKHSVALIYDVLGREVKRVMLEEKNSILLSGLTKGVYLLKIKDGQHDLLNKTILKE